MAVMNYFVCTHSAGAGDRRRNQAQLHVAGIRDTLMT